MPVWTSTFDRFVFANPKTQGTRHMTIDTMFDRVTNMKAFSVIITELTGDETDEVWALLEEWWEGQGK